MNPLSLFRETAVSVPAYRRFLKLHKIPVSRVKTLTDFQKLPLTDKKTYLKRHALRELFPAGQIPPMAYASSGSSGQPTFWFRGSEQETAGGKLHEMIFREVFRIEKTEPTLAVLCFSMGIWVAGGYTLAACRFVASQGYNLVSITPGIEKDDIINILKFFAPHFKNVIFAGYPPFLLDVVRQATRQKVNFSHGIKILTAGDKTTEDWREEMAGLLNIRRSANSIINIYGSADAGLMAFETPLTIFLRKSALRDPKLYKELFGEEVVAPGLFQYDPRQIFFEEQGGELLLTVKNGIPLIRYNIHDVGRVASYEEILRLLKKYGLTGRAKAAGLADWKLPFVVKAGRRDVAVTFYALNILPEHLEAGLADKKISKLLSGSYAAYNKKGRGSQAEALHLNLELAPKRKRLNKKMIQAVREAVTRRLLEMNMEFRKLYSVLGQKAVPVLSFSPYGEGRTLLIADRGLVGIKGKKPKVII